MDAKTKRQARVRRHGRVRKRIEGSGDVPRLAVYRSNRHIYAQLIDDTHARTLAAASDRDEGVSGEGKTGRAKAVGALLARRAKEAGLAVQKGIEEAKKNLFDVPLADSTITHPILGEAGAGRVLLRPAAPGTGVIAGGAARANLEMAGIHDVLAKTLGSSNTINVAHATIAGLKAQKRPDEIARLRGKTPEEVTPKGLLGSYNARKRGAHVPHEVA